MNLLLEADRIRVTLDERMVVDGVSLHVAAGQLLALIGPNGAGKTTLLAALAGLRPHQGTVRLLGHPRDALPGRERARTLAYLPQGHLAHWPLTVRRLVELGRLPHLAPWRAPVAADRLAVTEALQRADLVDLAERPFDTLSGGERARVMLARVLAVEAPLVLADEPVAALDPYHQLRVMELLRDYADGGAALIVVLHDLSLAARFCDELLLLHEGRLLARGPAEQVLSTAHLAEAYRVTALRGAHEGQHYVLPWRRLARATEAADGA